MVRKLLLSLFNLYCLFVGFNSHSQQLIGNEWINYDQNYIKITVDKPGVYRIFKNDLVKNGLFLNQLNPKNLKLIYRGVEMAIHINGESDSKFDDSDYIEFFAKKNDGIQDTLVYRPQSARPNKYLSIFSDKTAYFLTYSQTSGKRIINKDFVDKNLEPDDFFLVENLKIFNEDWNYDLSTGGVPFLAQSYFEPNETLVSNPIFFDGTVNKFEEAINLPNYFPNSLIKIDYESLICSRYFPKKIISVNIGNKNQKIQLDDYKLLFVKDTINNLTNQSLKLNYFIESSNSTNILNGKKYDLFSILYYKIKYPSSTIFQENQEVKIKPNFKGQSLIKLEKANKNISVYDIEDFYNQKKIGFQFEANNSTANIYFENTENGKKIWLSSDILTPQKIEKISFKKTEDKNISYIIITDSTFRASAEKFKLYRESDLGGNQVVQIGIKQDIFDEFSYGERNPYAIHKYLENIFKSGKPKYLLLLGKARSTPSFFKSNELEDFTPTLGFPASDALLSAGLNGKGKDIQSLATGRVAALKNEEILNYLEKLKQYEANNSNTTWKKQVLHLGGGRGESQINEFKKFLGKLGTISSNSKLGSDFSMLNKANALVGTENIDISKRINEGTGIVTFFGHSSSLALDLNIGFVSDEKANFKNAPNYPFMFFNGCAAGNVFQRTQSLTNDWIITPNKGAIAVLAHSFLSYSNTNTTYMEKLYNTWFSSVDMLNKPIGEVIMQVNEELVNSNPNDIYMIANTHQMILQGDPAVKIFNFTKPDFSIGSDKLFLIAETPSKSIANSSKISVNLIAENLGIFDKGVPLNIKLKKIFKDNKIEEQVIKFQSFGTKDTLSVIINNDLNLKSIEFIVDSDYKIDEINENNNIAKFDFDWEKLKKVEYLSTSPLEDNTNPILNVKFNNNILYDGIKLSKNDILDISLIDNFNFEIKSDKITVFIKQICDTCGDNLIPISIGTITGSSNEILSSIKLENLLAGNYQLFLQGFDSKNNSSGEVLSYFFTIETDATDFKLNVHPNPVSIFTNFEVNAPLDSKFELNIFNIQGKSIFTTSGDIVKGKNELFWNTKDNQNNIMPNGIYIYKLNINSNKNVKFEGKILLKN